MIIIQTVCLLPVLAKAYTLLKTSTFSTALSYTNDLMRSVCRPRLTTFMMREIATILLQLANSVVFVNSMFCLAFLLAEIMILCVPSDRHAGLWMLLCLVLLPLYVRLRRPIRWIGAIMADVLGFVVYCIVVMASVNALIRYYYGETITGAITKHIQEMLLFLYHTNSHQFRLIRTRSIAGAVQDQMDELWRW